MVKTDSYKQPQNPHSPSPQKEFPIIKISSPHTLSSLIKIILMTYLFHMKYFFHKMSYFIAVCGFVGRMKLYFLSSLWGACGFVLHCLPGLVQCTPCCDAVSVTTSVTSPYILEIESPFNW